MLRTEAIKTIQDYLQTFGIESQGLNDKNIGGAELGTLQVYFEYLEDKKALNCSVLLYKFTNPPKPQLLDAFQEEGQKNDVEMGDGFVDYQTENQCLMLTKAFKQNLPIDTFSKQMERLFSASNYWEETVLDRVADRVFQH